MQHVAKGRDRENMDLVKISQRHLLPIVFFTGRK